jgi:hypothetical protein
MSARNSTQRDVYYNVSRANSEAYCLPSWANLQHSIIMQLGFQQCCMTCDFILCQTCYQPRMFVQRAGSSFPSAAVLGMRSHPSILSLAATHACCHSVLSMPCVVVDLPVLAWRRSHCVGCCFCMQLVGRAGSQATCDVSTVIHPVLDMLRVPGSAQDISATSKGAVVGKETDGVRNLTVQPVTWSCAAPLQDEIF